ncbi:uracil-DNA glycosylase, partial [Candidatus Bathyarchaeota archaeon]|nr:uracil-DNA glycosylase [Candidatus Bathyarchaeota archaeon]
PYLDRQIMAIAPRLIVTLGRYSTAYIFSRAGLTFKGITDARGKFYNASFLGLEVMVFPTFHPAAGLYSGSYRQILIEDFRKLKVKVSEMKLA